MAIETSIHMSNRPRKRRRSTGNLYWFTVVMPAPYLTTTEPIKFKDTIQNPVFITRYRV